MKALKKDIENDGKNLDASISISLMLQFLFHELRHSQSVKRWLYKKLTLEFDELLNKTTIGKFFEAVKVIYFNNSTEIISSVSFGNISSKYLNEYYFKDFM